MKRFVSRHWPVFTAVVILTCAALIVAALLPDV
jgi:hypothetical protein